MKKMMLLSMLLVMAFPCGVSAKEAESEPVVEIEETADSSMIAPYADVIEYKYRYINGKVQCRRWNATKGVWVDPDWIDL